MTIIRLNYAIDLRYGVLLDIAQKVLNGDAIDLRMGYVNLIWQGDACNRILASFALVSVPPFILNITGKECISVRKLAEAFATKFDKKPVFINNEEGNSLLANAGKSFRLFGDVEVNLDDMIAMTSDWILNGGPVYGKPTKFEIKDGLF